LFFRFTNDQTMKHFTAIVFILMSLCLNAQYFSDGQSRWGIQWKKIESINFEVIYPEGFDAKAAEIAQMMEKSYLYATKTLNHQPKKVSLVLHTETVKSNAFLGWAPSRIEFYATPHQRTYSQDWLEQLAIHEYRHMIQLSKLEAEMPKLLRWLFGEQAAAILTGAYLPFWFIEGDAVAVETGLSHSGRGRLPHFNRELRAQLVESESYSYDKAYLGSYKSHVPNYYQLGYYMVGGARHFSGKTVWDDVLSNVAKKPLSLTPFDKGLKMSIGLNKTQLYDSVFSYLQRTWKAEDESILPTHTSAISRSNNLYTNYLYGQKVNDSVYVAYKTGLDNVPMFVSINENGEEKRVFSPGYIFSESVSGKGNKLIWSERLAHPRWQHADRSLIRILDVETGKLIEHKSNEKLFAPVLSPDNEQFLVVEADNSYHFYLSVYNVTTGTLVKKLENPFNDYYITPSWSTTGQHIYSVVLRNNEKAIVKISIDTGETSILLPFKNQEIIHPVEHGEYLFFVAGFSGIDQLYAIKPGESELFQVLASRFGVANPSFKQQQLIISKYTSDGYRLDQIALVPLKFIPVNSEGITATYPFADSIAKQEMGVIDFSGTDQIDYQSTKYRRASRLLNIHSWAPVAINPYSYSILPGVSVLSQNVLGTAEFMAGYRYRWESKQGEWYGKFRYLGWWPIIDADVFHGKRDTYYYQINRYANEQNQIVRTDTLQKEFTWFESNLTLSASMPFDLSKGRYRQKVQPRLRYIFMGVDGDRRAPGSFVSGNYHSYETGLYYYYILNSSARDLLPDFGLILDFSYQSTMVQGTGFGHVVGLSKLIYLPGLGKNHGISIYQGIQQKQRARYAFNDKVRFARGHRPVLNDRLYTLAADYRFPLWYPDLNIGRWVYFKRFKMNLFYDLSLFDGYNNINNSVAFYSGNLRSTGLELTSDLHLLRFIAPIEIGVRSSYLFNNRFDFDFLFNISFSF
jgi:hypothetical protein